MFEYDFIRNSIIVGFIIGMVLPSVGVIVMLRRMSFIADSFGHINMASIALSMYMVNVFPLIFNFQILFILIWTIISAVLIEYLRQKYSNYKELSIVIVYSLSVVLTIIFLNINEGYKSSILSILFGNISAISTSEVIITVLVFVFLLIISVLKYKKFLLLSLEEENVKLYNINPRLYKYSIMIIIALAITISIKAVGVLLVSSLLIIPLMSAGNLTNNLKDTWIYAIIITEFSILSGIIISIKYDIPSSAIIVLFTIIIYIFTLIWKKVGKTKGDC